MLLAAAAVLNQINIQRIHIYLCSNRYVMLCAVRVLCVECTSAVHSASSKCMNGLQIYWVSKKLPFSAQQMLIAHALQFWSDWSFRGKISDVFDRRHFFRLLFALNAILWRVYVMSKGRRDKYIHIHTTSTRVRVPTHATRTSLSLQ